MKHTAIVLTLLFVALAFGVPSYQGPMEGTPVAGPGLFPGGAPGANPPSVTTVPRIGPIAPNPVALDEIKSTRPPPANPGSVIQINGPEPAGSLPNLVTFDGLEQTRYPNPDQAIAAGLGEVVEIINPAWSIFDKYGHTLAAGSLSAMFRSVAAPPLIYNGKVIFDPAYQRWVITALGREDAMIAGKSYMLVAVSKTATALGEWWTWKLDAAMNGMLPANNIADNQALGYDNALLAITANMYDAETHQFQYAKVRVMDKAALFQGTLRTYTDYWALTWESGRVAFSVRPMRAPYASSPALYLLDAAYDAGSAVTLWRIDHAGSLPLFSRQASIPVRAYRAPPDAPQRGGSVLLSTGPVQVEDLYATGDALYATFHEMYPTLTNPTSAIRYLKILTSAAPAPNPNYAITSIRAAQDVTFGNGKTCFFDPSIIADQQGNVYFAFHYSDASLYAGTGFAGWPSAGTLSDAIILHPGEGYFDKGSPSPFGDFTDIALDPNADNVAWIGGEYALSAPNPSGRTTIQEANSTQPRPAPGGFWGTGLGELSFNPVRYQASPLVNNVSVHVTGNAIFKFGQTVPHWNAVALQSVNNWELSTWDANFTTLRARSMHQLPVQLTELCVSDGTHNPLDTMGVRAAFSGDNPAPTTIQFSEGPGTLNAAAQNGPFHWSSGDVVRVMDFPVTRGMDTCLAFTLSDGNADLGFALFRSYGPTMQAPYYANRYQAIAIADANGPGGNEYLHFSPPDADAVYGLVEWSNNSGTATYSFTEACALTGVKDKPGTPDKFALLSDYPSTFNTTATILYDVPVRSVAAVRVFSMQGRLVRTLADYTHEPGHYRSAWDGRDFRGQSVPAGSYIIRLIAPSFNAEQKVVKAE